MGKLVDISGQRFGRLTARARIGTTGRRESLWRCVCDCGETRDLRLQALRSGNTRSCGCLHREELAARARSSTKPVVTYQGVHYRLRVAFGSAGGHQCADCSGRAAEWSHDGLDSNPLADEKGRPYSLDLARYVPRCISCHRRHDKASTPYLTGVPA